jgi:hypothetical protein
MIFLLSSFSLVSAVLAQTQNPARAECPANEKSSGGLAIMGFDQTGLFGCGNATSPPSMSLAGLLQTVLPVLGMTGGGVGSGPFKSSYTASPGLAGHTLYKPTQAPLGKVPVIVWYVTFKEVVVQLILTS